MAAPPERPFMRRMSTNHQAGFTLVEVAVIAPIVILVLGGILALLIGLMSNNLASRGELETIENMNSALTTIEDDIKLASAFRTKIDTDFSDPYGKGIGNAWSYKGNGAGDRVLIMRTYATTRSPRDSLKSPVYINDNGCSTDALLSNPALNANMIYFVENGNLYRRTLTDIDEDTCSPQFQRQSCPPGVASPNALCKTDDALLLTNVSRFDVEYNDNPNDSVYLDPYPANNDTILDPAKAVKINITVTKKLGGRTFSLARELLASKLNAAN